MKSLVFICIGNACRSQMAEGFAHKMAKREALIFSAGSRPLGKILSGTVEVMKERGIDLSRHYSKGLAEVPDLEFDIAVLMGCGDECPSIRAKKRVQWEIPDPVGHSPDFFRETRDLIERKVQDLLCSEEVIFL